MDKFICCRLFNDALSTKALRTFEVDVAMIMHDELEVINAGRTVGVYLEVRSWISPGRTKENSGKPQSGYPLSRQKLGPSASRIEVKRLKHVV
jgi:hypothetical protein